MNRLVAYSDEDEPSEDARVDPKERRAQSDAGLEGIGGNKAGREKDSSTGTTTDLTWLAPPAKRSRNAEDGTIVIDAEWGLGSEKRSDDSDGERAVDAALEAKLAHYHELKAQSTHFNESLARNRSFRNPHIYAKLVEWVQVDETASAFDGMVRGDTQQADHAWRASSAARHEMMREGGAERLAALQKKRQEEADEAKARGRRSNIDFVASNESAKRDSKHALSSEVDAVARANTTRKDLSSRSVRQHGTSTTSSSASRQRNQHDVNRHRDSKRHRSQRDDERDYERDRRNLSHKSRDERAC